MLTEMVLDSLNVGLRLRPFSTGSWAAWLRQIIPHFISLYIKFLLELKIGLVTSPKDMKMFNLKLGQKFLPKIRSKILSWRV